MINCLVGGWLVADCLASWLVDWLVGLSLVGWLVSWLFVCLDG